MKAFDLDERAGGQGLRAAGAELEPRSLVVDDVLPEWDEFVGRCDGDIVQTTMWALAKGPAGRSFVVQIRGAQGQLVGGALVVTRRIAGMASIGYVARGPVTNKNSSSETDAAICQALLTEAQRKGLALLIAQPERPSLAECLRTMGFRSGAPDIAAAATLRIKLDQTDDAILAAMSSSRRRDIRRSEREFLRIYRSDDVQLFHRLHVLSASRNGFPPRSLDYLRAQWRALSPYDAVSILVAETGGKPVAAKWQTRFGRVVTARLSGWDADASGKLRVNVALHWQAMRQARDDGSEIYDFGGFDRRAAMDILSGQRQADAFRDTPHSFKLEFGGKPVVYPRACFIAPNRAADLLLSPIAAKLLRSKLGGTLAARLRNG